MKRSTPHYLAQLLFLAGVYFLAGRFGLSLYSVGKYAALVWPPSGIAMAALFLFGRRLWPGVMLGALLVNWNVGSPPGAALGISFGNTLEALLGAYILHQVCGIERKLERVRDILCLSCGVALPCTAVSATLGIAILALSGALSGPEVLPAWTQWWIGDALSVQLVMPLLLTWSVRPAVRPPPRRLAEFGVLAILLTLASLTIFDSLLPAWAEGHPIAFIISPLMIWAAFRFGQRGVTLALIVVSGIAITGTLHGHGQFAHGPLKLDLLYLQAFIGVSTFSSLLLAAFVVEHQTSIGLLRQAKRDLESRVRERTLELTQALDGLLRSGTQLVEAQKLAQLGSWEWEAASNRLTWSGELARIHGIPPEVKSSTLEEHLARVHPEDRELAGRTIRNAFTGGTGFRFEHRIVRPDGSVRTVLATGKEVPDPARGITGRMYGTCQDITEQKRFAKERELLLAVAMESRAEAERATRAKDLFLATLSHELRTPLSAILSWAQLLRTGKLPPEKYAKAFEIIEQGALTQSRMINDLLEVSRLVMGKLAVQLEPLETGDVVRAALELVRLQAEAKSLRIETDQDPRTGGILADANRLRQVVVNLLTNAIKFTPPGGKIRISLNRIREDGREFVQLRVSDSGLGIGPEFLPHLFDPFSQAKPAHTRVYGGLGLGLAIVRNLVGLMGGRVTAESPGENRGATFTVTLPALTGSRNPEFSPVSAAPAADAKGSLPEPHGALAGLRILIVDDDPSATEAFAEILRLHGALVLTAESAEDARSILSRTRPDLLLSDIAMPGEDGYSLIRGVRDREARETGPPLLAIAVTAYAGELAAKRALDAGFQFHLAKPVESRRLIEAITEVLKPRIADLRRAG